ncbi:hypothetical protein, partial [Streptomyces sp. MBT49]|uniref:hypothetical protein n=1 Tax=Streptomyces sp. MBT49 TaxID=1488380 RepID=UPI001F1EE96F
MTTRTLSSTILGPPAVHPLVEPVKHSDHGRGVLRARFPADFENGRTPEGTDTKGDGGGDAEALVKTVT